MNARKMPAERVPSPGWPVTLRSEWRKLVALRGVLLGVGAILAVAVVVGLFMATVSDPADVEVADGQSQYSAVFFSSGLTIWAYAFLAATFLAIEFQGAGESTFVATARRGRVLVSKLVLIGIGGLVVGLLTSALSLASIQSVLTARGLQTLDLSDPAVIRALLVLVPVSMAVQGLLAASFAVLVRSAALAVVVTGLISILPVRIAPILGETYSATVPRWLPGAAVESLAGVAEPGSYGYLAMPLAALCVLAWLAMASTAAGWRLPRTDIR
ncbi:hypothetical protein DNL40_11985 [Xylanimonas oleitrophica]|uniref:Uncharacterized protein n=1 Tax=Xylanimonas oleitrophica TaxID=2607479 RepID=A0A2W5WLD5_9MICO|nr:hypothetical protein [Xylanimonas oleitrophica]PZR52389.1 hypothetical protein DNL40_11985 [Xylanimonas oleitrophica]